MLATAKKVLRDHVNGAYPGLEAAGRILHPDDRERDVAGLLAQDVNSPVVILHSPQLAVAGPVSVYTCLVSVCALTENEALTHADTLLTTIRSVSPITPQRALAPDASVLQEDGFWRAAISFTLRVK